MRHLDKEERKILFGMLYDVGPKRLLDLLQLPDERQLQSWENEGGATEVRRDYNCTGKENETDQV